MGWIGQARAGGCVGAAWGEWGNGGMGLWGCGPGGGKWLWCRKQIFSLRSFFFGLEIIPRGILDEELPEMLENDGNARN